MRITRTYGTRNTYNYRKRLYRRSPAKPRVVVTGASGMLGSYLVARTACSRGYTDITILVRSLGSLDKIRAVWEAESYPSELSCLDIDGFHPEDTDSMYNVFKGADTVFNCAATVAIGGMMREEIIETNVNISPDGQPYRPWKRATGCWSMSVRWRLCSRLPAGRVDARFHPGLRVRTLIRMQKVSICPNWK